MLKSRPGPPDAARFSFDVAQICFHGRSVGVVGQSGTLVASVYIYLLRDPPVPPVPLAVFYI